ncbi:GNAT family N-acetyltransferase [Roseomonas sp. E05]|uniref:GNAT family N-acetyltransferase n=1 Tax=Roseomonas sp. E05 TaxID=3046310 RepID=UPI0024B89B9A|nr:GNAT family N-acetyltransferase [Roseomonas sp. E05]MDJ0389066.1 GNAT family N-acetyltransferase [Roseomonas sp. E05]
MIPPPLPFETMILERRHGPYRLSTDRALLDLDAIHRFLAEDSYWARGIGRGLVERAIRGSLPLGAYDAGGRLAGFARAVTDGAVFGYLRDVFVLPAHRGRGLGRALTAALLEHPDLAGLRNWMLATEDAHSLYATLGFAPVANPARLMQRRRPPDAPAS